METPPGKKSILPFTRRSRRLFLILFLVYLACLAEFASRCYWKFARKVPFFDSAQIWGAFYPEWLATGISE